MKSNVAQVEAAEQHALFRLRLAGYLQTCATNWFGPENWDSEALPFRESMFQYLFRMTRKTLAAYFGMVLAKIEEFHGLAKVLSQNESIGHFGELYSLLSDTYSKTLLVAIAAHRLTGFRKVILPLNRPEYWDMRKRLSRLADRKDFVNIRFRNFSLSRMNLSSIGYPIDIYFLPGGAATTFYLKQYEYCRDGNSCRAELGSYVIDAGGCWGDSALYFANAVGPNGRVFTFEFSPDNLDVMSKNLDLNKGLAERIQIVDSALWDISGGTLSYESNGPATCLLHGRKEEKQVSTITLDDFVAKQKVKRVDFVKMDIEGAELKALMGAEKTIRAFRPKLAISIYHNDADFSEVPSYIHSLDLGYKFFVDHFTIYRGETVLFCIPRDSLA
jgi:FkbM family methyltransferase